MTDRQEGRDEGEAGEELGQKGRPPGISRRLAGKVPPRRSKMMRIDAGRRTRRDQRDHGGGKHRSGNLRAELPDKGFGLQPSGRVVADGDCRVDVCAGNLTDHVDHAGNCKTCRKRNRQASDIARRIEAADRAGCSRHEDKGECAEAFGRDAFHHGASISLTSMKRDMSSWAPSRPEDAAGRALGNRFRSVRSVGALPSNELQHCVEILRERRGRCDGAPGVG